MIGRAREAEAIARFVERVLDGPAGLVIEGEPGIGKTTVWLEAVGDLGRRGYRVLKARPAESEADLSFAALGDLVGAVIDDVSVDLPAPQRRALDVALLCRDDDAPVDLRTTAMALLGVLASLSARDPLVVAIDDAQWLDPASRRAIEFAVRRLPPRVGVIVTTRPDGTAAGPLDLGRALRPDRLERLALGPLSLAALHHLIDQTHGIRFPRPTLVRIAETSAGNPFYAVEIARVLARSDGDGASGLSDPIPLSRALHELVGDRLRQLSPAAREAALVAAALSHATATSVAAALEPAVDASTALLEAEATGILGWDGDRLRFAHPLLASAVYGSVPAGRRRVLHRRLAEVATDREERARHLARGVGSPEETVAHEIEEAAGLAARRGAPDAAAELFEAACRLTPVGQREDLARRTLGGAEAHATAGDLERAQVLATSVLDAADGVSPRERALRARALQLLGALASYTGGLEMRVAFGRRALLEADDDRELRVEILLSLFEGIGVSAASAAAHADEAIALLRDDARSPLLAQALMNKVVAHAVLGHGARIDLLEQALALKDRVAARPLAYVPLWYQWNDDLEAARAHHGLHDTYHRGIGDLFGAAELVEFLAIVEFRAGNWDLAEGMLEDACATLAQFGLQGPVTASFADRSVIDAHRGRVERARRTLADILNTEPLDVIWRMVCHSAQGAVEFCAGDHEAADRAWVAMRIEAEQIEWRDNLEDRSEPDHIETLLALGRPDDARRILDHLRWRGRTLPRPWIDATLPRAEALVLAADGDLDAALAVLDGAPEVPHLPFERGRLLLVRGQIERRANRKLAARASLSAALSTFERLGSPPWAQRARTELARLGLRHRAPDELSATERLIAELAATGMTNRQVAEAAFVSPKTVEASLSRVYQKLGIRSRAELGARMAATAGVEAEQT